MTDDQLRALVRDAVARHLGTGTEAASVGAAPAGAGEPGSVPLVLLRHHASHYRYGLTTGEDSDGPCLIEPAVRCNHCGYCQSHGH